MKSLLKRERKYNLSSYIFPGKLVALQLCLGRFDVHYEFQFRLDLQTLLGAFLHIHNKYHKCDFVCDYLFKMFRLQGPTFRGLHMTLFRINKCNITATSYSREETLLLYVLGVFHTYPYLLKLVEESFPLCSVVTSLFLLPYSCGQCDDRSMKCLFPCGTCSSSAEKQLDYIRNIPYPKIDERYGSMFHIKERESYIHLSAFHRNLSRTPIKCILEMLEPHIIKRIVNSIQVKPISFNNSFQVYEMTDSLLGATSLNLHTHFKYINIGRCNESLLNHIDSHNSINAIPSFIETLSQLTVKKYLRSSVIRECKIEPHYVAYKKELPEISTPVDKYVDYLELETKVDVMNMFPKIKYEPDLREREDPFIYKAYVKPHLTDDEFMSDWQRKANLAAERVDEEKHEVEQINIIRRNIAKKAQEERQSYQQHLEEKFKSTKESFNDDEIIVFKNEEKFKSTKESSDDDEIIVFKSTEQKVKEKEEEPEDEDLIIKFKSLKKVKSVSTESDLFNEVMKAETDEAIITEVLSKPSKYNQILEDGTKPDIYKTKEDKFKNENDVFGDEIDDEEKKRNALIRYEFMKKFNFNGDTNPENFYPFLRHCTKTLSYQQITESDEDDYN